MIEFMVLGPPRSGTTWVSNLLTTEYTSCIHDPLWTTHYKDLDKLKSKKILGIACTGLFMFPDFVNDHPARKIILHRDLNDINTSLAKIGLPLITKDQNHSLYDLRGIHVSWKSMFDEVGAKYIFEHLTQLEFDKERFALLKQIKMQPNFHTVMVNPKLTTQLVKEIQER
jgi:hypothetical protein